MNSRVQAFIQIFEPGQGWVHFRTLALDDEQRLVLTDWLAEDADRHLSPRARPQDVALMSGAELWALPDDELQAIFPGPWGCCAYYAMQAFIPYIDTAVEARLGEEVRTAVTAAVIEQRGYDGEAFRRLPRRARMEFLERINADPAPAETVEH